jgi:hypothetical protein
MDEVKQHLSEAIANLDMASRKAEQMGDDILVDELFLIVRKLDTYRKQV